MTPGLGIAYIGGSITVPTGVQNLLDLIRQLLNANCPGSATEVRIEPDGANSGTVVIGSYSPIAGVVTATNYGCKLAATSPARVYRSTYPGGSVALGNLQVLPSAASQVIHIEVQS